MISHLEACGKGVGMAKRKDSEVEMFGELKQMEAGRSAAEMGWELRVSKHKSATDFFSRPFASSN